MLVGGGLSATAVPTRKTGEKMHVEEDFLEACWLIEIGDNEWNLNDKYSTNMKL